MFLIVRLLHQATSHALCWLVIFGDGLPWIEFGHFVWFSYSWSSLWWYLVAVICCYNLLLKDNVGKIKQTVKLYWCVGMVPRCSKCFFCHYGILWGGTILTLPSDPVSASDGTDILLCPGTTWRRIRVLIRWWPGEFLHLSMPVTGCQHG